MDIQDEIKWLISPAIDVRAPFAKYLVVALAKLVTDEREACAKTADYWAENAGDASDACSGIAADIRARGGK